MRLGNIGCGEWPQDVPYTVFQPQYIYGPYTGKDCEQWFIDRVIR